MKPKIFSADENRNPFSDGKRHEKSREMISCAGEGEELRSFDVLFTAPSASSRFKFPFNGFLIFQRCFIWHPMMHVKIVSGFVCLFIHQLNTFKCGTEHKKRGARKESENKSIRVFKVHFIRLFYIDYKGG